MSPPVIHWRAFPRPIKRADGSTSLVEFSDQGEQDAGSYLTLYRIDGEVFPSPYMSTGPGMGSAEARFEQDLRALAAAGVDPDDVRACVYERFDDVDEQADHTDQHQAGE